MSTYPEVRDQAMRDLIRDPREVVYAADVRIGELEMEVEQEAWNRDVGFGLFRCAILMVPQVQLHMLELELARLSAPIAKQRRRITVIDEQAADNFLAYLAQNDDLWWYTLCGVMVTTGMRPGELVALHEDDVSLTESTIEVQAGASEDDEGVVEGEGKTGEARRIRLHQRTVQMLAAWDLERDSLRRKYGDRWDEHGLVFPAVDLRGGRPGRLMRPKALTRRWARGREEAGLQKRMRLYDLRHSHATHLLHAGVNIKVVAERLGHDETMTLERYAFALPDMQAAAVDALGWLNVLK